MRHSPKLSVWFQSFACALGLALLCWGTPRACAAPEVLVVTGIHGQPAFGAEIEATAKIWMEAAGRGGHTVQHIAPGTGPQLPRLQTALAAVDGASTDPFWLVLLGHGSAQGKAPKFQLEGPDLSAEELALNLRRLRRPVIVVAGFACSGAFLKALAAPERIVVTATRSGAEENWTRFPKLFASALAGLEADSDGDMQVSVLEAWQHAAQTVEASYKEQGRLATEHAALDDLGDGKGSGPDLGKRAARWHLVESAAEAKLTIAQRSKREALEWELGQLRDRKEKIPGAEYTEQLERLLLKLAEVYSEPVEHKK